MAVFLPPIPLGKPKWWLPYVLLLMVILFIFWKLSPGGFISLMDSLSPFHVGTPRISGTVVNALTGRPVPQMDVCLLVTKAVSSFDHRGKEARVMRSVMTQTDASGKFFFDRWDDQLDLLDSWEGYGIAVTDPAAFWNSVCGKDVYLLAARTPSGDVDVFRREIFFHPDPAAPSSPPYFPVAMVKDPLDPQPQPYGASVSFGPLFEFPDATFLRKIDDPSKLKIALVPLLRDEKECRLVQDSELADLCRQMNHSRTADALRTSWNFSPSRH
jgi:hypothetical protein